MGHIKPAPWTPHGKVALSLCKALWFYFDILTQVYSAGIELKQLHHSEEAASTRGIIITAASLLLFNSTSSLQDAGIGFILVIDRRLDKWTSVKASILRIAVSPLMLNQQLHTQGPWGICLFSFHVKQPCFYINDLPFILHQSVIHSDRTSEMHVSRHPKTELHAAF